MRGRLLLATCVALALLTTVFVPAGGADGDDPSVTGRWLTPFDGEVPAVSMALLHDNSILYWSGVEAAHEHDEDMTFFLSHPHDAQWRVLDLDTMTVSEPGGDTGSDLFCAGHTILPDGRVLAAGGTDYTTIPEAGQWDVLYGTPDARIYDPATRTWELTTPMDDGRWYPTVMTLSDGRALAASGIETLTQPMTMQTSLETFEAASEDWSPAGERLLPMYPRLLEVPRGPLEGKVFYSTLSTLWGPFGEHPLEAEWSLQQSYDVSTREWTDLTPSLFGARQHGVSVMLPLDPAEAYDTEVLSFGGTLQRSVAAVPFSEIADLSGDSGLPVANRFAAPMENPRWHGNGVLLPDGTVLAVGGGLYDNVVVHGQPDVPVLPAEAYDPATDSWTTLASMQVPRMYHSTALLLPDGRVLAGGHVPLPVPFKTARDDPTLSSTPFSQAQVQETRFEIFEPPYLFRGDRPTFTTSDTELGYGEPFSIQVANADGDDLRVALVKAGATTHAWDATERMVWLEADQVGGSLSVTSPPDALVAPPGWWMLFVDRVLDDGSLVPSVATWVHVG